VVEASREEVRFFDGRRDTGEVHFAVEELFEMVSFG
tara:strand:- start:1222 stop:1329 length:108 start_codon:yes stop_codon:yes gene_type:complete